MAKEKIQVAEYASRILTALPRGILLNTQGEKFNSMVIGWGHLGFIWNQWHFIVYVRENRYTKPVLDATREFSISIPLGDPDPKINRICGAMSGRDCDKVALAGLTLVEPDVIATPLVKEYPLSLECRVNYAQPQDLARLPDAIRSSMYPADVDGVQVGANRDPHSMCFGQIVSAYIIR